MTTSREFSTVSLIVSGDPDEVTKRVGIAPTAGKTGRWRLSATGPGAYGAPMLPNQLALELLGLVGDRADAFAAWRDEGLTKVHFLLSLPRLLTFSFELAPTVTERLALLGPLVFSFRESQVDAPLERFDDTGACSVALVLNGHSYLETESEPAQDVNALARGILARLPERAPREDLRGAPGLSLIFSFRRSGLAGYFEIDAAIAAELAGIGAKLSIWLGNDAA